MDNDIYGLNVNKTARIQSSVEKEGICVSDSIKEDFIKAYGTDAPLKFSLSGIRIKNFRHSRVWNVINRDLRDSFRKIAKKRNELLGVKPENPAISPTNPVNATITPRLAPISPPEQSDKSLFANVDWKTIFDKTTHKN